MSKLSSKISFPIILAGVFAVTIFIALNYQNTDPSFYIVLLLLVLFTFFFGFSIGRSLSSPIRELLEKAIALRNGNLTTRVYLETKDELADLAGVLNEIAEELQSSQNDKKKAEEVVDIKVRAKTKALEETISGLDQKVKNRTIELERLIKEVKRLQDELAGNKKGGGAQPEETVNIL